MPLVVGDGAAAALIFWHNDFKAIRLQHSNSGLVHVGIEATLHTAKNKPHSAAALTCCRVENLQSILKTCCFKRRQQGLHRFPFGPKSFVDTEAAAERLYWCPRVGTQRLQKGAQAAGIGEQLQQDLAKVVLAGAAKFCLVQ